MQQDCCPLCLRSYEGKTVCLDHYHITGLIREPLCRFCNSQLGKVENAAIRAVGKGNYYSFLERAISYIKTHIDNPSSFEHPTHNKPKKRKSKKTTFLA